MALVGYAGATLSLAASVSADEPALAHRLIPGDGRFTAALAEQQLIEGQKQSGRMAQSLALQALRQDPTAVTAVVTLGLVSKLDSHQFSPDRFFAYSQLLSRRDYQTQLWTIEEAVNNGDISTALRHYDIALRTTQSAPGLLYPVLAAAIAQPSVRSGLVTTLKSRPAWAGTFLSYVGQYGSTPVATADLFTALHRAQVQIPSDAVSTAINRLAATEPLQAWDFYAAMRPGATRTAARDPHFTADLDAPSVFDWTPINDASVSTAIGHDETGGVFQFSVPSSTGGTLLQQLQLLPPGTYQLAGHATGVAQPPQSLPYWSLKCQNGQELGRVAVSDGDRHNGVFSGSFIIPPTCPVQTLMLVARPSDDIAGLSGQIDQVRLVRAPV